jgi:hypothetical protein
LETGPIFVNGVKMPNTADAGPALNLFPGADGVQHCEIAGMRDALDSYAASLPKWAWLQRWIAGKNWDTKVRTIPHNAPVHPTVKARAGLSTVPQCASVGPYRPEALRGPDEFKQLYP